jgi:DNA-binding response OmpR family regulator
MSEGNPLELVVDDEVQIRRFLGAGLELDGFAVEEAENGDEASRWAGDFNPVRSSVTA